MSSRDLPDFGPGPDRLVVDGRDVAALTVADTPSSRRRGLLGTGRLHGALWITRCNSVHMVGMHYPIDVATVDRAGVVRSVARLKPWTGITWPWFGTTASIEMPAGALEEWGIAVGSRLERRSGGSLQQD